MNVTLCGLSALYAWRAIRTGATSARPIGSCALKKPSPSPYKRWSKGALASLPQEIVGTPTLEHPLHIAASSPVVRVRGKAVCSSVYARTLPEGAFVSLDTANPNDTIAISSPEFLFVEMGAVMHPVVQLVLGFELCGKFSRDPEHPRSGDVAYDVRPLTTPCRLREFIDRCSRFANLEQTRMVAELIQGEAWSPMEAVVASLLVLPPTDFGYGFDRIVLNPRIDLDHRISTGQSRVPDIVFAGTHVGINYDGESDHLGLGRIARMASEETSPHDLDEAVRTARALVVGDKRRDRDLLVGGYQVLPITSEDLYERGGLDLVVKQAIALIESETKCDLRLQKNVLSRKSFALERQRILWSLLPGARGIRLLRELVEEREHPAESHGRIEETYIEFEI